ncbi:hypothetical protein Mterra_02527 [Calidithermus terrae]|uniref:Uncharacterized protein n=1 Tax=Calidithermus terrae TaxID=1408545 RepID=A0A399EKT8_9DEIN|nr:hypothetical protein [Calidithermus terrae]RIH82781.1 hypothetical protein Mterra_02527 [Calidithermus terrae]
MFGLIAAAAIVIGSLFLPAAPEGMYAASPVELQAGQAVQARAGSTTYVQLTQDPAGWGLSKGDVSDLVYVDDDGYAPNPTARLERFWVLDEGAPAGWAVFVPDSQATRDGAIVNTYGIRIPEGTPAGQYALEVQVRDNESGQVYTFPLTVNVG